LHRTLTEKYQIRLSKEDSAVLHKIAEAWRCDPVDVIRRALAELFARNGYLSEQDMKALGISRRTKCGKCGAELYPLKLEALRQ